jgi:hypothetical protein
MERLASTCLGGRVVDHSPAIRKIEFLTALQADSPIVDGFSSRMPRLNGAEEAMANAQPVTCQIRYTLDLSKLSAFESYARTWIVLIERYGGIHHGYFIPRTSPDIMGVSFPGLGFDGPSDVAVAMFSFPDNESYRRYREMVATDPECLSAAALVRETGCFIRYERLFLERVKRP